MDGKSIFTVGLLGGAAYLAYQAFNSPMIGAPLQTPAVSANPLTPAQVLAASTPPTASLPPIVPVTITTPQITAPAPVATPSNLSAAASAQGLPGSLTPDQWNWLTVYVVGAPAFSLDAFGPTSQPSRTAAYGSDDFVAMATGARPVPAPSSTVAAQTCPPYCGSDTANYLVGLANSNSLTPDQWNSYVNGIYNLDSAFGAVGTPARSASISAQTFLSSVAASTGGGVAGLGTALNRRVFNNPIIRPNVPNTGRWVPHSQRPAAIPGAIYRTGGWAV